MPEQNDENVYKEIIDGNEDDKSLEDKKEKIEGASEDEEITQPDKERKLTEDDVKRLGISKSYVGKPYQETVESVILGLNKGFVKMSQKISDFEKKFETKLTPEQKEKVEEKVEDKLPSMPDPFEKPEKFQEWLDKRDELTKKAIIKEVKDQFSTQDLTKKIGELEADKNKSIFVDAVVDGLQALYEDDYEEKMLDTLIKEYNEYLEGLGDEDYADYQKIYMGKPKRLATDMLRFHKATLYEKSKKPKNKETETHDEKVDKLKKKSKLFTKTASSSRDKHVEEDKESPYKELIEEAEQNLENE